jgi:glycogen phosphorylase
MTDKPLKSSDPSGRHHGVRTGLSIEDIKQSFLDNLFCGMGRAQAIATPNDLYTALALTVRDRVLHRSVHTFY